MDSRPITTILNRTGFHISRPTVQKYMREMGIAAIYLKPNLSKRNLQHTVFPCLLRGIKTGFPNHVWGTDITYIRLRRGWFYLVAFMDWFYLDDPAESRMKERIKNMLSFKKPSRFMIISAVILAAALGLGLALNHDDGNPIRAGKTGPPAPKLNITTPRELYSPFMSSIFGFELVVQGAPPGTAELNYVCDKGSFCTYDNAQIKGWGDNVTTAETIYWRAFSEENQRFITEDGEILITVTAFDGEAQILASGNAFVECGSGGGWFKFLGGKSADPYSAKTSAPAGDGK